MERNRIGAEEAFHLLYRASQERNTTILGLAEQVTASGALPD